MWLIKSPSGFFFLWYNISMTKALLTNLNTVWGVIINPQSSNTYRHILSFKDETTKKAFINRELFGGKDYEQELDKQPEIGFTQVTAVTAVFSVNKKDYPNESYDSLLNKDFAIIKEEGKTKFYTLQGTRKGQTVEYQADLDIFFTYDIRKMFTGQTQIKQAMLDRYKYENFKLKYAFMKDNDTVDYTHPIFNNEEFDNISPDSLVQKGDTMYLGYDYKPHMQSFISNDVLSDDIKRKANDFLNKLVWNTMAIGNTDQPKGDDFNGNKVPYYVITWANHPDNGYSKVPEISVDFYKETYPTNDNTLKISASTENQTIYKLLKTPNVLKSTRQMSLVNPLIENHLFYIDNGTPKGKVIVHHGAGDISKIELVVEHMKTNYNKTEVFGRGGVRIATVNVGGDLNEHYLTISRHGRMWADDLGDILYSGYRIVDKPDYNPLELKLTKKDLIDPIAYWNPETEVKAKFAPYQMLQIKGVTNNTFNYEPQYLISKYQLQWDLLNSYELSLSKVLIYSRNYKNIYKKPSSVENRFFIDVGAYNMPTTSTELDEFNARHKEQYSSGMLSKGLKAGLGAAGLMAGVLTGGIGAMPFLAMSSSLAVNSAMEIKGQMAQKEDLKNAPPHVNNASTSWMFDSYIKDYRYKVTLYGLEPNEDLLIKQHFYKYGYNLKDRVDDINKYLDSRERFNYIQAKGVFENIYLQASGEIKQIINDTLESGLTIWHVRDAYAFKGVKNYRYPNPERSLYA